MGKKIEKTENTGGKGSRSNYTESPKVAPELMPRLAGIIQVLAGLKTLSEVARELNLSRNHFQTLVHRSMYAMIETLEPKEPGRRPKPEAMSALEQRVRALERQNARLTKRLEATDELFMVARELLHGQPHVGVRPRRSRKKSQAPSGETDPDEHARIARAVERMHRLGLTRACASRLAGYDAATLRRWRAHRSAPPRRCTPPLPLASIEAAEHLVRDLHGLVGAAALSHSIAGLSRRQAALIKAHTLTVMERERQARLRHVKIRVPGLVRGFDAMMKVDGVHHALICADAAVPYRTSVHVTDRYDAEQVARALSADFARHGAPLVLRDDRARAHEAPAVRAVLEAHAVLTLHGPPRYPCFYGQLERQNREHRAWLAALVDPLGAPMEQLLRQMLYSLNHLWRRPTLKWQSAAQMWNARTPISVDTRLAFREEVKVRTQRMQRTLDHRGQPADQAERLAIEQTLHKMGYLELQCGR